MFRILHFSNKTGDKESIYITEDLVTPASDFEGKGMVVTSDVKHDSILPSGFPLDYYFERQ
jgi:hypothetical protein